MKNKFKAIVLDIDGTFSHIDGTTTKRNIDVLEKCRDSGYLVALASGRPLEDIAEKYKLWNLRNQFDFIISWNGCELYDNKTKTKYQYNYLKKEELKEIIEFMSEFDATINMYIDKLYYSSKETGRAIFSAGRINRQFVFVNDLEKFYQRDNGGIMFRTTVDKMPIIENKIKKYLTNKNYVGFKTQEDLMEFSNKNCNKAFALKKYCEMYDIDVNKVISFGDTTNDNEMLKVSYGVCMKNGSNDTKACAKEITDLTCDEDGFADYAEKHLL